MKKILAVLIFSIIAFCIYWFTLRSKEGNSAPRQQALEVKKHSAAFNTSIATAMQGYFEMKNAFVDADTAKIKQAGKKFIALVDSIPLDEIKKDTAAIYADAASKIEDIKANTSSIITQTDITEMRHDFSWLSEALYPFFKLINYEGEKLYLQNCPMAFGEDKGANWISNSTEIINPYLGKTHPEYKGTMLHCGSVKDTIKSQ